MQINTTQNWWDNITTQLDEWVDIPTASKTIPNANIHHLRYLIRNRKSNDFDKCLIKEAGKFYISLPRYRGWKESKIGQA